MAQFRIQGGHQLAGHIPIEGAKNAALPLLALTALTDQICVLRGVPKIADVLVLLDMLERLGAQIHWRDESTLEVNCANIDPSRLDKTLVRKLRASILLIGSLLARFRRVATPHPGGCILGKRSLDAHFSAWRALGASVDVGKADDFVINMDTPIPARIVLPEASVTATENLLALAATIPGETQIRNAASEPHVQNVAQALVQMGVSIEGIGSHVLTVGGIDRLGGFDIQVVPDQLEVGSFIALAAMTRSQLTMGPVVLDHLDPILVKLDTIGIRYTISGDQLTVLPAQSLRPFHLTTNIWPGFPTDLQAPFAVLATQAEGNSMIHDWMYEGRLFYIDKLIKMGADITLCDPHRIIVSGPTPLHGKAIESPDIRAGMALLIAALGADGTSLIEHVELIDRGYLHIEKRLQAVGAQIERIEQ